MSNQPLPAQSVSGVAGAELNLTLYPLLDAGQTALAPDRETFVLNIALTRVVLRWRNAFNEMTIRKADDLFACAAVNGNYYDPVPKGADLVQATLSVQFSDAAEPRTVDIIPPHTLTLQNPADAPRILRLLARRGFTAAQKLALALLLVTAACALPDAGYADPPTFDGDDDAAEDCIPPLCAAVEFKNQR
jgi:hypothetical protein